MSIRGVLVAGLVTLAAALPAHTAESRELRFVDAHSGDPLRNAEIVVALEGATVPTKQRAPFSRVVRTDAGGRAPIENVDRATAIVATHGDLRARTGPAEDGLVALARPGVLVARVLEHDGSGAVGVPVHLRGRHSLLDHTDSTAPHGIALLSHEMLSAPPSWHSQHRPIMAAVAIPLTEPIQAEVEGGGAVLPTTTLRLPRLPSLLVRVNGIPEGRVRVRHPTRWLNEQETAALYARPIVDGIARFPWIGRGVDVLVETVVDDPERPTARATVRTSTQPHATTEVTLGVGAARAAVRGRLVDPDGMPLDGVRVEVRQSLIGEVGGHRDAVRTSATTDADGRFEATFDGAARELAGRVVTIAQFFRRPGMGGGGDLVPLARRILPDDLGAAGYDAGELVGGDGTILLAGTVVDEAGAPVNEIVVWVKQRVGERWTRSTGVGRTDVTGRFVCRSPVLGDRLRIMVSGDEYYLPELPEFEVGQRDARIVLHRGGRIEVATNVPDGVPFLLAELRGEAARGSRSSERDGVRRLGVRWVHGAQPRGSAFAADGVPAGAATLHLRLRNETVWSSPPLTIDLDTPNTTLAETPIDVAAHLHEHAIRVMGPDGDVATSPEIWVRPARTLYGWLPATVDARGVATVFRGPGPLQVLARVDDATAFAPEVRADHTLAVRKHTPRTVRVRVPDATRLPHRDVARVNVGLLFVGETADGLVDPGHHIGSGPFGASGGKMRYGRRTLDAEGATELTLPHPGVYAVSFSLDAVNPAGGGSNGGSIPAPLTLVDTTAGSGPIDVVVEPDWEHVRIRLLPLDGP